MKANPPKADNCRRKAIHLFGIQAAREITLNAEPFNPTGEALNAESVGTT
jgi:hypothetical protein